MREKQGGRLHLPCNHKSYSSLRSVGRQDLRPQYAIFGSTPTWGCSTTRNPPERFTPDFLFFVFFCDCLLQIRVQRRCCYPRHTFVSNFQSLSAFSVIVLDCALCFGIYLLTLQEIKFFNKGTAPASLATAAHTAMRPSELL